MKSGLSLIGVILIILGVIGYSYNYFTYTTREKVLEVGPVQVTADTEKSVTIPPLLSGAAIAAGLVLVIVGGISRRK